MPKEVIMKKCFNLKVVTIMAVVLMMTINLSAQTLTLRKPDLEIVKITVARDCKLAVVVKNNGPGMLPDRVWTHPHPKSAGVYVYINGKKWGGQTIKGFDPGKKLQKPGGVATCILRYKVGPPITVKGVVDLWNDVKEANERNNTHTRENLSCRTGETRKLPDLIVKDIRLIKDCKIEVTVKNIGTAGVPPSYYNLPNAVGVQMYKGTKPWGGIILKGFDPAGNLQAPGGTASHIWFPKAANLDLTPGTHSIKVIVDHGGVLTELSETNNSLTRRLICKKTIGPIATTTTLKPVTPVLTLKPPQRFFLDFKDAYLAYVPKTKSIQIIAQLNVLSYGGDWEKCNMKPYLYHLRQKFWKGFYWKVNTSRKEVYRVTGGSFCKLGGKEQKLNITVDVVGGSNTKPPDRFFLRFPKAYLVYVPSSKTIQITTEGNVLSYGGDWNKCNMKSYLYHLMLKTWKGFYWKVNTSKKQAWRVRKGQFCKLGGTEELLDVGVRVVN